MSDNVTLDPETLERLRVARSRCTGLKLSAGEVVEVLRAAERLPQVVAERDRAQEVVWGTTQRANLAEARAKAAEDLLAQVRETAARSYFSAECRAAMSEVLEVLGDS